MNTLAKIGTALIVLGIGVFILSLSMSNYTLTQEVIAETIKSEHQEKLQPVLSFMVDKEYNSKFAFISDFNSAFDGYNQQLKDAKDWGNVIWDKYTMNVVKNSSTGILVQQGWLWFLLSFGLCIIGALIYILTTYKYQTHATKNTGMFTHALNFRGWIGIGLGIMLILFYIFLYFYPEYLTNWFLIVDPFSYALNGGPASQWFLYGLLYTFAVIVMGIRMFIKYRHSNYQKVRTASVMFFQFSFAFFIPEMMARFKLPAMDFKNSWPLDYSFFFDWRVGQHLEAGNLGIFMIVWGVALFVIGVPTFTFFFGKRWYCSWVCGCGGLAETLGDPFRHQSSKTLLSWKVERILIHTVLVFAVIMTAAVAYHSFTKFSPGMDEQTSVLGLIDVYQLRDWYGFAIGSMFAGVVGTGFYPLMGNRVWCRFGCPLAAYMGLVQRFKSKFRITTNGAQCISCGNCSTYCEMGIDVKWYAQRGQNIVRSSCVGCGLCADVCPRGVLRLENGEDEGRINSNPILIGSDGVATDVNLMG